ncbi:MAG: T9SS type B sorting domain-containing protein, partial [Flavobacteriaceae bacterium]
SFFNVDGTPLPSPLSNPFQNTVPYRQTILVRVASKKDLDCFSETSFELVVNAPLEIDLKEKYYLCDPETTLTLSVDPTMDFWEWRNDAGSILSYSYLVDLTNGGNYSLTVGKTVKGIQCEKTFSFSVEQPKVPKIEEIRINDFSSSNTVEVLASAEEAIEYSIDGLHYQNSNLFLDVLGGAYTMHVRNINGCGTTTKNIFILDYPKFFTPNNDGVNDYWHIKGIEGFSNVTVQIFDRYGKLLKQLTSGHLGWDGTLNGRKLPSSDYWFTLKMQNGRTIKNHFTLKR